jgi:polysaccharide export outer membrane protein
MLKRIGIFLFLTTLFVSCVPHKDIVYFQGEPTNEHTIREINKTPYRLQVDDILHIDIKAPNDELVAVFKNNTVQQNTGQITQGMYYFSGYSIDNQGYIEIPYLRKINVLGYTTEEVSNKISLELGKYFKNLSDIFVSVKLAGVKYTILGEVGSTGSKVLSQNSVTIIEAIANAGDIGLTGDKKNVEIIRVGIDGVQKFHIDLTQMNVFNSEVFYIQPNDIINVPALHQKTLGTGTTGVQTLSTVVSVLSLITTTYLLIKSL